MKKIFILAFAVLSQGSFFSAFAASKVVEEEAVVESVSCSHGTDSRQLVVQTKEAGCILHYTKYGKTEEAGASKRNVEICKASLAKIRSRLEAAGYQCK